MSRTSVPAILLTIVLGTRTAQRAHGSVPFVFNASGDATVQSVEARAQDGPVCFPPVLLDASTELVKVVCKSQPFSLAPGQMLVDHVLELGNPFPDEGLYQISAVEFDIQDARGRPVPLDEVFVHHWYSNHSEMGAAIGANYRYGYMRTSLPDSYAIVVDAASEIDTTIGATFVNIIGIDPAAKQQCMECWCSTERNSSAIEVADRAKEGAAGGLGSTEGGLECCSESNCPTSRAGDPPTLYHVVRTHYYRPVTDEVKPASVIVTEPVAMVYVPQIGEDQVFTLNYTVPVVDVYCPQTRGLRIVRCAAHLHVGAKGCLTATNSVTGEVICRSCPVYGTEPGMPGNEAGFLVATTIDDPDYFLKAGHGITVTADYDASRAHVATNAALDMVVGDMDFTGCPDWTRFVDIRPNTQSYSTRMRASAMYTSKYCG